MTEVVADVVDVFPREVNVAVAKHTGALEDYDTPRPGFWLWIVVVNERFDGKVVDRKNRVCKGAIEHVEWHDARTTARVVVHDE